MMTIRLLVILYISHSADVDNQISVVLSSGITCRKSLSHTFTGDHKNRASTELTRNLVLIITVIVNPPSSLCYFPAITMLLA